MEDSVMRQWKGKEQTSQQPFGPNDQPKILCTRIRTVPGAGVVVKVGKQVKVEEKLLDLKPKNLDFIQAASLPLAIETSYEASSGGGLPTMAFYAKTDSFDMFTVIVGNFDGAIILWKYRRPAAPILTRRVYIFANLVGRPPPRGSSQRKFKCRGTGISLDIALGCKHEYMRVEAKKFYQGFGQTFTTVVSILVSLAFAALVTIPGGSSGSTGVPVFLSLDKGTKNKDTMGTIFRWYFFLTLAGLIGGILAQMEFVHFITSDYRVKESRSRLPCGLARGVFLWIACSGLLGSTCFGTPLFLQPERNDVPCGRVCKDDHNLVTTCTNTRIDKRLQLGGKIVYL
ncbi:hypothetical protein Tco_0275753 [Tanacetum coccineum]